MSKSYTFPDYYPDRCPPAEARDANQVVYRFVESNPPCESDFLPHRIRYPGRQFSDECQACGLSVFSDIESLMQMRSILPKSHQRNWKYIAEGRLRPGCGVIMPTPNDGSPAHMTWWVACGVVPRDMFRAVREVG